MSGTSAFVLLNDEPAKTRRGGGGGKAKLQAAGTRSKSRGAGGKKVRPGREYKGLRRGRVWGQRPGRSVSTLGGRFKAVVKSRYVLRSGGAAGRLGRYLDYIQNRERAEFEPERSFFTKDRSGLDRADMQSELEAKFGKKVAFHEIIVSPGDNGVNLKDYVRQTMKEWEQYLGYELEYGATEHYNTDNYHAHVVLAGRSADGQKDIILDREDLAELREFGNQYLARERMLDRHFDREVEVDFKLRWADYNDHDVQRELGLTWYREWLDQVEIGLRTDLDIARELRELGLDRVYDLGRPFQSLDRPEELAIIKRLYEEEQAAKGQPQSQSKDEWDKEVDDIWERANNPGDREDDNSRFTSKRPDFDQFIYDDAPGQKTGHESDDHEPGSQEASTGREDHDDDQGQFRAGRGAR